MLIVNLSHVGRIDNYDKAKSLNTMPSLFGIYIISHSKRLMNDVINQKSGVYSNRIYYLDKYSMYIQKKYWSSLVDIGFVGKTLRLGKNDYDSSGVFYAWFLIQKVNCC